MSTLILTPQPVVNLLMTGPMDPLTLSISPPPALTLVLNEAPPGSVTTDGVESLSNKTLIDPIIDAILDANGNEALELPATASAVNHIKLVNSATGTGPTVTVGGDDSNADLLLAGKGTGVVKADGSLVRTVGKETIWMPAGAMTPRTTNGAAVGTVETTTNKVMIKTLDFDSAVVEYAQFGVCMPKGWNRGTVTASFKWRHAATTTNFGVAWSLAAVAVGDDDAMDVAFGTAQTATKTGGTTNDFYTTAETSAITIAGTPATQDYVIFQVAREVANGSDTMAIDASLIGVFVHYTTEAATDA